MSCSVETKHQKGKNKTNQVDLIDYKNTQKYSGNKTKKNKDHPQHLIVTAKPLKHFKLYIKIDLEWNYSS